MWARLAAEIRGDLPEQLHFVAVLKGSFVFLSDLFRRIEGPVSLDFMALSSYATGDPLLGEVRLLKDLDAQSKAATSSSSRTSSTPGVTLTYLHEILRARGPRTLRTACFSTSRPRRRVEIAPDYVGFTIDDDFVVGYGLDHADQYRNLSFIAVPDL